MMQESARICLDTEGVVRTTAHQSDIDNRTKQACCDHPCLTGACHARYVGPIAIYQPPTSSSYIPILVTSIHTVQPQYTLCPMYSNSLGVACFMM
jgi:hypothetical protein